MVQPPSPHLKSTLAGIFNENSDGLGASALTLTDDLTTTEAICVRQFSAGGLVLPESCGVTAIAWYGAATPTGTKGRIHGSDASTTGINCGSAAQAVALPASAASWSYLYAVLTGATSVEAEWCLKE